MARKLTKLKINEVSLVSEGANDGAKVMIYKMRDHAQRSSDYADTFRKAFGKAKPPLEVEDEDTATGDNAHDSEKLPGSMDQFVNALQVANPSLSREDAVRYLLHGVHGRATARHMSETFKTKEPPMSRADGLTKIVKQSGGLLRVAKAIATSGDAAGISEHELSALAFEECKKHALPGERPNSTFARWFSEPDQLAVRKAIQIAKNTPVDKAYPQLMDMKPTTVEVGSSATADDSRKAYAQLTAMAEAMRAKSPTLTAAQCFARVFEDTKNAELAAKAHRRPSATAGYAMP